MVGLCAWMADSSASASRTSPYSRAQASYDLRRLRLKGLLDRLPHTNTYTITPDGARFALFYTKVHDKILTPLMSADHPPAPDELRQALATIDHHIDERLARARLEKSAQTSKC